MGPPEVNMEVDPTRSEHRSGPPSGSEHRSGPPGSEHRSGSPQK